MDPQRSIRAYEVFRFTKKSFFSYKSDTKLNFENKIFKKIFINFPRDLLINKIEQRVDKMFNNGVLEEVENFLKMKIDKDLSVNKIIGIREIRDYLNGKTNLIQTKQLIVQKTRQYAKRQFTWARGHMRSWEMVYSPNMNELFKKTINKIS